MSVTELQHVLVLSDDIDRACEFYEHAVGLRAGERPAFDFTGYWMYAGSTPCLHIADRASYRAHALTLGLEVPERISGPGQVDHIAFGATDYEAFSERLARAGVQPLRREIPGGGPRQLFFFDPDGQRIEINFLGPSREAGGDG
ncbi:MAG TPA: VOC family protein [Solirubrobacteraceae bacterium]|jgi:catechol 2,3-dioxygenase-like lactoylglutathione lyase family enzyme